MGSQIEEIFAAIKGQAVTANGRTPTVLNVAEIRGEIQPADCPVRLLLPTGWRAPESDFHFVALGKTNTVTWHIADLCLWRPLGEGEVDSSVFLELVRYAAAYVDVLRGFRSPTAQSHVVRAIPDVPPLVEWPVGSGRWFYGVEFVLEIQEVISDA